LPNVTATASAPARPATVFGRSCYDAVHLLPGLTRAGRRPKASTMAQRFSRLTGRRPSRAGLPSALLTAASGQVHFAEAQGLVFKVLATR